MFSMFRHHVCPKHEDYSNEKVPSKKPFVNILRQHCIFICNIVLSGESSLRVHCNKLCENRKHPRWQIINQPRLRSAQHWVVSCEFRDPFKIKGPVSCAKSAFILTQNR